ncbi:hypothetical protein [Listeria booriae]|uniref:hypothetical protein n=1 Tax=Listeria booriae TaxID=1552123 RepID=UPI0016270B0A|nr:hypothetical protein [Listeria booriae]MBC1290614.1 hypothetical protein [Listeria booriae]MBC2163435.1 hypothetical protein [Listeria booriae]
MEKELGKISSAEFGNVEFFFGLDLRFSLGNGGGCGFQKQGLYNPSYKHYAGGEKSQKALEVIDFTRNLLKEAKADYVSELVGKPVEVHFKNNACVGFRILTEVL